VFREIKIWNAGKQFLNTIQKYVTEKIQNVFLFKGILLVSYLNGGAYCAESNCLIIASPSGVTKCAISMEVTKNMDRKV